MRTFLLRLICFGSVVFIATPSEGCDCTALLNKVNSYPKERLWELVTKAPPCCKMVVKKAVFERRRVIVDDFKRTQ